MKNNRNLFILLFSFMMSGVLGQQKLLANLPSTVITKSEQNMEMKAVADETFLVNEIQVGNNGMFVDPSFNFGGWIELYNPTSHDIHLTDIFISDDVTHLKKYRLVNDDACIKNKSFKVFWFGANNDTPTNVNFNLDYDGGILYFSNANGEIFLTQIYPPSINRTSYARKVDGGDEWAYTDRPTPGATNVTSTFAAERLSAPAIDTDSKLFTTPFDFKVSHPQGTILKYTTDGSIPGVLGGKVTEDSIFSVSETAIYRFCLVQDGKLPSQVVTRSFIKDDHHLNFPVISLVVNKDYLYDDSLGIFVRGSNGKTGNGQSSPCNWNMDWNRPANIELISLDGKMSVNQEVDICTAGGWTRAHSPHSFKIKAKKKFEGLNYLPYPIFKTKPNLRYKTWQARNGGNDYKNRMKDAALQAIVHSSGIDIDGQACQPVMHYINGKFKGLINLREPNNRDFAYANFGWDDNEIDQFQICGDSNYCQMCGTDEAFLKWYHLSANAQDRNTYKEICKIVDIDEYVNYMAVEMFYGCVDYAKNNVKGYRPRTPDGKFRIVLYDLDSALGTSDPLNYFENKQWHTFHFDSDNDGDPHEEVKFVTIFLNMMENAKFRKKFIDTYSLVCGSIFEYKRCEAIIDSMAQERVAPLALENLSPLELATSLKKDLNGRPKSMIKAMKNYKRLRLQDMEEVNLQLMSNNEKGRLIVNDIPVPTNKFDGSLFLPVTLRAVAPSGYKFVGWSYKDAIKTAPVFSKGSSWKYFDQGSCDGKQWKTGEECITWKEGQTPMGFNKKSAEVDNLFKVKLDYGPDEGNKRPTYYFFKDFDLGTELNADNTYFVDFEIDDGAVVYVNGQELVRFAMPEGEITYNTFTTKYAHTWPDKYRYEIPYELLKKNNNTIAVEVHNTSAGSSDIYFDCELSVSKKNNDEGEIVDTNDTYPVYPKGYINLTACFEPLSEEEQGELMPPVVINEISADNTIFTNEYFKRNDWIELYNRTNDTIDIAGMYLSDDRLNIHKYQIVEDMSKYATQIAPHGHLVLWADWLPSKSQIHTNFKLAREGGEVILTSADESWADTLIYEAHSDKYSVGRYPDGAEQLYIMTLPTFGETNMLNSYATKFEEPLYPVGIESVDITEESLVIRYEKGQLCLYSDALAPVSVSLYNISGQCLMQRRVDVEGGRTAIDLNHLRRGSYIAKASDAEGHQSIVKFVVTGGW